MRVILVATLAAGFVLAGCQTTPEDQSAAAVEDRSKPGAKPGADAGHDDDLTVEDHEVTSS